MLDRIVDLLRPYLGAPWGYVIVGTATFLENSVGAGFIVPGETLVILGGFYARLEELHLVWITAIVCTFAVLGDNLGYLIGRRYGRAFLDRHGRKLFVTAERLEKADRYYATHGGKTVFLGRFVPVARSVGFIVAGIAHMDWRRFLVYDIAGAVLWGTGHTLLGYAIGASYERWEGYLTTAGLGLVVVVVVLVGFSTLRAARRSVERDRQALDAGEDERPTLRLQVGTETTDE